MNLAELADQLKLSHKGDSCKNISCIKDIERLDSPQKIHRNAIYYLENRGMLKKYPLLQDESIRDEIIVLIPDSLSEKFKNAVIAPMSEVRLYFIQLLYLFSKAPKFFGNEKSPFQSPQSVVHDSALISPSAKIMPLAVVMENVEIGDDSIVYPHVTIEPGAKIGKHTIVYPGVVVGYNCIIGNHCILYAGSIIGADGFGYHDHGKERHKIPQISHVEIRDYVEIGANSTIDRGTIEPTIIGKHTKIDNQVQIGHNCRLGEYIFIAGNAGISGSVNIADRAILGGKAGIADHLNIAEGSVIMAGTGLHLDTKPKTVYFGYPSRPGKEAHRINGALSHLPELLKRFRELEKKVYDKSDGD